MSNHLQSSVVPAPMCTWQADPKSPFVCIGVGGGSILALKMHRL
jgi:hypothetical protein